MLFHPYLHVFSLFLIQNWIGFGFLNFIYYECVIDGGMYV